MTWTRTQYVSFARKQADAENSNRWSDDDIKTLLGVVHRREWRALLDTAPDYRQNERAILVNAGAQVSLADLSITSGDAQELLYKVRQIRNAGSTGSAPLVYQQVDPLDYLAANASASASGTGVWWRAGSVLQFLSGDIGASVTVVVNHTPTPIDQLSADNVDVEWPDGHELVLVFETAALMLGKGGTETEQAADLRALASVERERLYADVQRVSTRPLGWRYGDSSGDWGGV